MAIESQNDGCYATAPVEATGSTKQRTVSFSDTKQQQQQQSTSNQDPNIMRAGNGEF